ncbi:MAG TPA: DUF5696 domain-containing protein [Planctomycetota bacterium]|nr:DUF5696 domain-containing protein [Planctomycetota bacterium]
MKKSPAATITLQSADLTVTIDAGNAAFDVRQKRSGTRWVMDRSDERDLAVRRADGVDLFAALKSARNRTGGLIGPNEARVEFRDFAGLNSPLAVQITFALNGPELALEINVIDADPRYRFDSLYYPRSFLLPNQKDSYWLFPMHGGELLPAADRFDEDGRLGWKPALKCHGAVQGASGFLCLWDTPWDVWLGKVNTKRNGPTLVPRLIASLGRFGYTRKFRLVFREKTGYVDLIRNVYKPWARRRGYVRTLQEKIAENKNVADLAGGLMFHQLISYVDRRSLVKKEVSFAHAGQVFERVVRETGVKNGCYHLDGWCRQGYDALHPDVFPPLISAGGHKGLVELSQAVHKSGWHFGLHDNYLLFFPDAERFRDRHCVWDANLDPVRDDFRAGGMNFVMSPPAGREFLIANYLTGQNILRRRWPAAGKAYNLDFCYLDQYLLSGGSVEEDFNPAHRLNREQFIQGLLENIRIMREEVGCITSSEHMYDFGVPLYDVNGNSTGLVPADPAPGCVPAPLWNLAFHECLVVNHAPETAPEMAMAGLLGAFLHHRHSLYHDTEAGVARNIQVIQASAPIRQLHAELMLRECTGSRLISADGTRQVAEYEGIAVEADLKAGTIDITGAKKANGHFDFRQTV